jgi:hypothetical protein
VAAPASDDARAAGERVEALLAELGSRAGPDAAGVAEELVTCLVRLYGAGLATIMRLAASDDKLVAQLIADPLVESLLLIHDLHPLDASTRIKRAVVRVKLASGCGNTAAAVEQAITDAAPEITSVDFAPRDLPLLQIARRRPAGTK